MITQHKKLNLQKPKFNCDIDLNPLNNSPPFSHLNKFFCLGIIGKSGSGKTSMLYSLITHSKILRRTYNHIILYSPEESIQSMESDLFENFTDVNNGLEYDLLEDTESDIREHSKEGETTLLIIDDMAAYLKNKDVANLLKSMIWNKRHLKLSIIILVQVYNAIPLTIRKSLTDTIIMYKPSLSEFKNLVDELIEKKEQINEIIDFGFKKKYDWLFIHLDSQQFYNSTFEELNLR